MTRVRVRTVVRSTCKYSARFTVPLRQSWPRSCTGRGQCSPIENLRASALGRILLRCVRLAFVLALPSPSPAALSVGSSPVVAMTPISRCLKHAGGSVLPPEAAQTLPHRVPSRAAAPRCAGGFSGRRGRWSARGSGRENPFWDRGGQDPRGDELAVDPQGGAGVGILGASRKPAPPDERAMGLSRRARTNARVRNRPRHLC